jgi:hypothetical protein
MSGMNRKRPPRRVVNWRLQEAAAIGDGFDGGSDLVRPRRRRVAATGEAFVLQDLTDGGAERFPVASPADVVDRVVALAQGNDLVAAAALLGCDLGPLRAVAKNSGRRRCRNRWQRT